jgi:hypothetical protein
MAQDQAVPRGTKQEHVDAVVKLRARVRREDVKLVVGRRERVTNCKSCHTEVFWGRSTNGKPTLVDCDVTGGIRPTADAEGIGASHHATCPQGPQWSRRNPPKAGAR